MHPAAKLQFERIAQEYALWRTVPQEERSPAPAWWWQSAMQVVGQHEAMPGSLCERLDLSLGCTYSNGASVLLAPLVKQTSQPRPDEFPRKLNSEIAKAE
jgi:hypothetical protein